MANKLLIVDCDGTVSRVKNVFYEVAQKLSCYSPIRGYAEEYLAGKISYDELIDRQNPIFREAGRLYAQRTGRKKLSRQLFTALLDSVTGERCVSPATLDCLTKVRNRGSRDAMTSEVRAV